MRLDRFRPTNPSEDGRERIGGRPENKRQPKGSRYKAQETWETRVEKEARISKMIEEMWIVDGTKREKQGWVPNSIPVAVGWAGAELPVFSLFEHYALWTDGRTDG